MKIAIIGAGNVGGTLGRGWAQKGHEVIFGVRDAKDEKIKSVLVSAGMNARATSVAEAAGAADIVVLSVPWPAEDAVKSCGNLTGKILIDCTNPLKPDKDSFDRLSEARERQCYPLLNEPKSS